MFGEIVGDLAERHLATETGRPMAHGLYLAAVANTLGPDTEVLGRHISIEVLAPAYAGDVVEAATTLTRARAAGAFGDWIEAEVVYRNQDGTTLARGGFSGFARRRPPDFPDATPSSHPGS